jgi:hypothetical protein
MGTHNNRILINLITRLWTNDNKKPAISNGFSTSLDFIGLCLGGDEGDRTPGLGIANAALSQLSYIPSVIAPDRKCIPYTPPAEFSFRDAPSFFMGFTINDPARTCQEFVD